MLPSSGPAGFAGKPEIGLGKERCTSYLGYLSWVVAFKKQVEFLKDKSSVTQFSSVSEI